MNFVAGKMKHIKNIMSSEDRPGVAEQASMTRKSLVLIGKRYLVHSLYEFLMQSAAG
jgi:hypothetical protein